MHALRALGLLPLPLFAQPLPQDCSADSQALVRSRAESGDKKAQYVLGAQLSSGKCGSNEPQTGLEFLARSAAQYYPPSLHLVGVIYRREGKLTDAIPFFYGAAQRGFRLAAMDLGFAHSTKGTPAHNDPLAFAWFSLGLEHEARPELRKFLEAQLAELTARMSESERIKGEQLRTKLLADIGSVPRFSDDP